MMYSGIVNRLLDRAFVRIADTGDGFPAYVAAATRAGVDVNDWIERELGWMPALPILEQLVFPLLSADCVVCEVGVGTGRWSRHIAPRIPNGELVLVDKSQWIVNFLSDYFRGRPSVRAVLCDGASLPFDRDQWMDVVFSQGLFITLRLGHIYRYLREFARELKPGGFAVFDFIDPATTEGWAFMERESAAAYDSFSYNSSDAVAKCCAAAGLEVIRSCNIGKSTYFVTRKTF
jgi:ubiquinone/menaquinone biosynthesis C-methylase UbiE